MRTKRKQYGRPPPAQESHLVACGGGFLSVKMSISLHLKGAHLLFIIILRILLSPLVNANVLNGGEILPVIHHNAFI